MSSGAAQKRAQPVDRKPVGSVDAETARPQVPAPQAAEHVDKIRDILFGSNMREYDRHFAQIEARLTKEVSDLKEETRKRLDSLESSSKREIEALNSRLNAEREERGEINATLRQDLAELSKSLEKKSRQFEEHSTRMEREIREQIAALGRSASEELRRKHEELTALMERRFSELLEQKLDRLALATLLNELAMRLNNEPGMATLESLAHGRSTD